MLHRLMEAGITVFGRLGLAGARITDVAREMGVSHGTIYNYVESKEALFYLLVDWWMRDGPPDLEDADLPLAAPSEDRLLGRLEERIRELFVLERLDRALARSGPVEDAAGEVRAIVEELYDRTSKTRRAADMIERSARDVPALAAFFDTRVRRPLFDRMETYLRTRSRKGLVRTPDPEAGARLLIETVTYAARHRHGDPQPPEATEESFRKATVELLTRGLLPDGSPVEGVERSGPR